MRRASERGERWPFVAGLRGKLGESLASVQKFDVPIEATTNSLEDLKNYSKGIKMGDEKGDAASVPFLKRAVELDPNFPMAYAALSVTYHNLEQPSLALEYARKAYELRNRATERDGSISPLITFPPLENLTRLARPTSCG